MRLMGPTAILTVLSLAFPCASFALGLGDIQLQSALSEPLVAQIEIVGATADDLARLRATIADEDMFRRHGIERPSFLSSIVISVGQDKQQHPVLLLRSTDSISEPMATFVVDVHSSSGDLIREYTVLLDPPGLTRPNTVEATPSVAAPSSVETSTSSEGSTSVEVATSVEAAPQVEVAVIQTTAPSRHAVRSSAATIVTTQSSSDTYTVAPHDTLDRIVRVAGAHSVSDRHRMMVAIFRANHEAFGINVNVLHSGATLQLPSAAELSAISIDDADREIAAQMSAWRAGRRVPEQIASVPVAAAVKQPESDAGADADDPDIAVLNERIAVAEKALAQVQQELARPLVVPAAAPEPASEPPAAVDTDDAPSQGMSLVWPAIGLGIALGLLAAVWLYRRRKGGRADAEEAVPVRRRRYQDLMPSPATSSLDTDVKHASAGTTQSVPPLYKDSRHIRHQSPLLDEATVEVEVSLVQDAATTVVLPPRVQERRGNADPSFIFNPEATINTTHVTLASDLNDQPAFLERRKNPADVLRQAIEREPDRSDLRLKLLELYYIAAAQNQRAFLEIARELAKNEKFASAKEWSQIVDMGRKIAPTDELFADKSDDQAVA